MLESLAHHCNDDGLGARPALDTLALESEVCRRITPSCLATLVDKGLITLQQAASQHRPATWKINMESVAELVDNYGFTYLKAEDQARVTMLRAASEQRRAEHDHARLGATEQQSTDVHHDAHLNTGDSNTSPKPEAHLDAPLETPDTQNEVSDAQNQHSGAHDHAHDPVILSDPKDRTAPQTARFRNLEKEPNGENLKPIRLQALQAIDNDPSLGQGANISALIEVVKQRCADLRIVYGGGAEVPMFQVHRACGWAQIVHFKRRKYPERISA